MYLWLLAVGPLASVLVACCLMITMMKVQKPNIVSRSPHHLGNTKTDLANASAGK